MGLDSYLKATKLISGYSWEERGNKSEYNNLLNVFGLSLGDVAEDSPGANVEIVVAYWRKANEIHNWFVNNVQGGEDKCQSSYVPREKLEELIGVCEKVLENHKLAAELLPTKSGFFFGGIDYDNYYFEDLEKTAKKLKKILNNPELQNWHFEYQASW